MMRVIASVFKKEVRENLRDRRTIVSAFIFVPLLGPLLFAAMTAFMVDRVVGEADEPLRIAMIGNEYAPNLVEFFRANGAEVVTLPNQVDRARSDVQRGQENFVLVVTTAFGKQLNSADTATLDLIWDSSNNKAQRHVARVRALVDGYSRKLGALRLLARGVDPTVISAIEVRTDDVATPSGRALILLGTLTYFLLFALLLGGLYLAIDVTAGERERGSLEPLLSLPVPRSSLVIGKVAATMLFMLLALSVSLIALSLSMPFLRLEKLGMASNFSPIIVVKIAAIMAPMALFGSALLFIVGSFTRSYREAQTWLGAVLAVPTLPILFAGMANVRASTPLMLVPSLSQHLIATNLLRGDPINPLHVAVSILSTLGMGAVLLVIATRLYQRERLLG